MKLASRSEIRAVEWAAYFFNRTRAAERAPANPALCAVLDELPGLAAEPLVEQSCVLRERLGRGVFIQLALGAATHATVEDRFALGDALPRIVAAFDACDSRFGTEFDNRLHRSIARLEDCVGELQAAGGGARDVVEEVAALTGDALPLQLALAPSLLLPPPQDGRHGVSFSFGDETRAWLCFGYPLSDDPAAFGIDAQFLNFGGWSYALRFWLDRYAPCLRDLDAHPTLAELGRRVDPTRPFSELVRSHLGLALRARLGASVGATVDQFRLMARARGLPWFDWFVEWLEDPGGSSLSGRLPSLERDLERSERELAKRSRLAFPSAINLLLMSRQRGSPVLVLPDDVSPALRARIQSGYAALRMPTLSHAEWAAAPERSAIAVGAEAANPLVARVLERRGLSLDAADGAERPVVVALECPSHGREPWFICVAANEDAVAAEVVLEQLMRLTGDVAFMDGKRVCRVESRLPPPEGPA